MLMNAKKKKKENDGKISRMIQFWNENCGQPKKLNKTKHNKAKQNQGRYPRLFRSGNLVRAGGLQETSS